MPTIFDSFTKLIGPYLDELSGGVLKSRCEHCTIGAALDHLNHLEIWSPRRKFTTRRGARSQQNISEEMHTTSARSSRCGTISLDLFYSKVLFAWWPW